MSITYDKIMKAINDSKHARYLIHDAEFLDKSELNYTGKEINGKIVIKYLGTGANNDYMWLVECCNCGRLSVIEDKALALKRKTGKCKYCISSKSFDSTTLFYRLWKKLVNRFIDTNNERYYAYKLGDITLCDEWLQYENFKKDMYGTYIKGSSLTLNNGCSEFNKKNVRWC